MNALSFEQVAVGVAVFVFTVALLALLVGLNARRRLRDRLGRLDGADRRVADSDEDRDWIESVAKISGPLARLALPADAQALTAMRLQFVQAGWRNPRTPLVFFALKTCLAFGLPIVAFLVCANLGDSPETSTIALVAAVAGLVGLYAPTSALRAATASRKRELFEGFPDALDLMTVCMEAGLSLEAALLRVAQEMAETSPTLAAELQLVVLEMRAGRGREEALRNLARRTGVDEIESLVSTLVQAEQFGISVSQSLRVHSGMLRTKRRQRIEEAAAKIGTKLTFPLMICILPAVMLVVGGPAVINILKNL
jgi:tight adherence protein C